MDNGKPLNRHEQDQKSNQHAPFGQEQAVYQQLSLPVPQHRQKVHFRIKRAGYGTRRYR